MKKLLGLLLTLVLLISITIPQTAYAKPKTPTTKQLSIDYKSDIEALYFIDTVHNNLVPWIKNNSLNDFSEVKIIVEFYLKGKVVDSIEKTKTDFKSYYSILYTIPIKVVYDEIKITVLEVVK